MSLECNFKRQPPVQILLMAHVLFESCKITGSHSHNARQSCWARQVSNHSLDGESNGEDLLRENLDGAAAKSLMTISADSLIADHDITIATAVPACDIITHQERRPRTGDLCRP